MRFNPNVHTFRPISLACCALALLSLVGCAKSAKDREAMAVTPGYTPTLVDVAKAYNESCAGGGRESNNCAHYLADAFIRAGFYDLKTSKLITEHCKCGAGRAVRSQDLLKWFQEKSTRFHQGRPDANTGFWAAYQEKPGERHVTLIDTATGKFYGTADCKDWPIQWYYQW
jgi:hypothetical protein